MKHLGVIAAFLFANIIDGVQVIIPPMYRDDGQSLAVDFEGPIDVYGLLGENCHIFKDAEACTNVMDGLNSIVHGITNYTPRTKTRTIEDATTARWDIILSLIQNYKYTKYLEIGCAGNEVFSRIKDSVTLAIGVDPAKGGTHRMTSDEFFQSNTEKFDVIFIDGDHNAKQVIIDVNNALEVLEEGGTIVMHDCNPRVELRQIPHDNPNHTYNGDVWKVALSLRLRTDLEIVIIDVDHGMGVVRRRPNLHPLPAEFAEKLLAAENVLEAFNYQDLNAHREEFLSNCYREVFVSYLSLSYAALCKSMDVVCRATGSNSTSWVAARTSHNAVATYDQEQ